MIQHPEARMAENRGRRPRARVGFL